MELEPELDEAWSALFERLLKSEECAAAACGPARWLFSFLDSLRAVEWSLDELDLTPSTLCWHDGPLDDSQELDCDVDRDPPLAN